MSGYDWRKHPDAPLPGRILCALGDLEDDTPGEIFLTEEEELDDEEDDDAFSVVVIRQGEVVRAYVNSCPHKRLRLNRRSQGELLYEGGELRCSNHMARFRISDGLCTRGFCEGESLARVPVRIERGGVVVGDPDDRD